MAHENIDVPEFSVVLMRTMRLSSQSLLFSGSIFKITYNAAPRVFRYSNFNA